MKFNPTPVPSEAERIRSVYTERSMRRVDLRYGMLRAENWSGVQSLERALIRSVTSSGFSDLAPLQIMDAGCGRGGALLRWIMWGADPRKCAGVDLVEEHIADARHRLPAEVDLRVGDGSSMPFGDDAFDITSQFTVLSSILDDGMQRAFAAELLRVTRPAGVILSYDFWLNPVNPSTRGIRLGRLRELFPGCKLLVQRITLAPPLARTLAPYSVVLCRILEALKVLNSHYLVAIRPSSKLEK